MNGLICNWGLYWSDIDWW